ncbi:abnormal spindle-like microcephaly-associated protein homolog isoform X2 [Jatropha curcas]|uniref:abnormal spindle-like microcephaly-associated protein homolog isoform X2 n=1 Tax=Jatropha curcas TaxID=180498 RepID=UPI001893D693|nr:abnormal spindle-like microcephaly-associated protein homolog isoform X2 [Jatropha curcas]
MEGNDQPCPSPYAPASSSSSLLKDISNFRTPKRPSHISNFTSSPYPQFFTASKQTPRQSPSSSFRRYHHRPSLSGRPKHKTATARRLKAFELEQSKSSRKVQIKKEQSLQSLAKSLTTWLNFLFQNPRSCGCELTINGDQDMGPAGKLGKRDSGPRVGVVGVDAAWRSPKRQRDLKWRGGDHLELKGDESLSSFKYYGSLRNSLKDICSFDDLKQRMGAYLSLASCKEIFDVMTHVVKNIDEGRLKMKPHCPIVTDVGMKEKATRILMCYNPIWLRVGLHIILGGDSLLPDGDVNSDQEIAFLKMVIEKQFFSHAGLAKAYAYNKMVEGLYRPGYYENLGNVLLKRFLLLVLILDRVKSRSTLSLKYGIDGVDGGSPLLFKLQSSIKSSRQMINDFLSSEIMLGEGNLLAHLVIVGYKASYQQCPLVEYDFRVTDIFLDLQDGVRLCRAIQLLQNDSSILMKMVVPSDTRKKNLVNCGVALQHLKHAGVKLCDGDGMTIMEDDVANGDKELTINLLWNVFIHLQLPLLISGTILTEEILKIRGSNVDPLKGINLGSSSLELLLNWIQAVCETYDHKVDSFSSLVDGKAIWCLLDYYFRRELYCSQSLKNPHDNKGGESIMSAADYTDAVHNFILSQKLITLLGNFPEVLQISDILEHNGAISEQSVVILLVFLASQLTAKKTMLNFHKLLSCNCQSHERRHSDGENSVLSVKGLLDHEEVDGHNTGDAARKFKAIKAWWQDMAERNKKFVTEPATSTLQNNSTSKSKVNILKGNAATLIQSHLRRSVARRNFLKTINAIFFLQTVIRAWLMVKQKSALNNFSILSVQESIYEKWKQSDRVGRYVQCIVDRHSFVKLRKSVIFIQQAARIWMKERLNCRSSRNHGVFIIDLVNAAIIIQKYFRGWIARSGCKVIQMKTASRMCQVNSSDIETEAAIKIQRSWKNYISSRSLLNQHLAAARIQSHFRGMLLRRKFLKQKQVVIKLQSNIRRAKCWKSYQELRTTTRSAIIIQSHIRGWIARRAAWRNRQLVGLLKRCCRGWLTRKNYLLKREAAIEIQSAIRCFNCSKAFHCSKIAAVEIQRFVRGQITRKSLLGASHFQSATDANFNLQTSVGCTQSFELKMMISSILKLQRWWRSVSSLKLRIKSVILIQSYLRGWIARREVSRERHCAVMIQSHWRGYLLRKDSKGKLLDLRLRVQKSAKNVDDSMRIINRLKMALSELLSMKSISGILHNCATLDMTTEHSQRCCEELVAAGAIGILLKLICSVSRSVPDQQVLKHALSTIRNLTRYQHLIQVLIESEGSIEIIFLEFLRNKEEGYFIASEILKKIFSEHRGAKTLRKLPALLKRLNSLVEEQTRKATIEKRNPHGVSAKEKAERRLREALELLKLMKTH